jgi:hypothetical protein
MENASNLNIGDSKIKMIVLWAGGQEKKMLRHKQVQSLSNAIFVKEVI